MIKIIIISFMLKFFIFINFLKAENYYETNNFLKEETKNYILFKPKFYKTINNKVGNFDYINIKLITNKSRNCETFYVRVIYKDDYSYVKNNSEIIEIHRGVKELNLNIFQSKIFSEEFGFYKFKKRFDETDINILEFKGIMIHKKDIECISNLKTSIISENLNFYEKKINNILFSKNNKVIYEDNKPFLDLLETEYQHKSLKINKNSIFFNDFINSYGEYWNKEKIYSNFFKTNIIDKFELNFIVKDLFIGNIEGKEDTSFILSCKIEKGAIRILIYNEKDDYINKIMKCSSNEKSSFKLKKNQSSKIVVSSYLSDYTYKHLKFSLDLFYN